MTVYRVQAPCGCMICCEVFTPPRTTNEADVNAAWIDAPCLTHKEKRADGPGSAVERVDAYLRAHLPADTDVDTADLARRAVKAARNRAAPYPDIGQPCAGMECDGGTDLCVDCDQEIDEWRKSNMP